MGDYSNYLTSLRRNDERLRELVATLADLGDYGKNTCLVVTTDHGRGVGDRWTRHSNGEPFSGLVAMYAGCPLSEEGPTLWDRRAILSHLDIRPTIERLVGLEPTRCAVGCGSSLAL